MKKHLQSLKKISADLERSHELGPDISEAIDKVISAVKKLPEPSSLKSGNLSAPAEIKGHREGLALYTDGACRGNPGPGAWACVAQDESGGIVFESCGFEVRTTNNKMEIQAVIGAFQQLENYLMDHPLTQFSPMMLFTDSKYVVDGLNTWVVGWKSRGWKKADGKAPENLEQWQELESLKNKFPQCKVDWVKGHSGHPQNEYCDQMANKLLDEEGY